MQTQFLTCVCVSLRACVRRGACLRAALIKTQNAFAHKIFQHSNTFWVQKLSGCTIVSIRITVHWLCTYIHTGYEINTRHTSRHVSGVARTIITVIIIARAHNN